MEGLNMEIIKGLRIPVQQRIVPWRKSQDRVWSNGADDRVGSGDERRGRVCG
jgi:hypothetical protein